jgi:diguanylate cyclase (GGDEF)-like protein
MPPVLRPPCLNDVRALLSDGTFEGALDLATHRSVALVREGRNDDASSALVLLAEILCTLNQPLRARAFAEEALEMARKSGNAGVQGDAHATSVLALLRLGEIDKAEAELAASLEELDTVAPLEVGPLSMLVGTEVALATDKVREGRALAECALAAATAEGNTVYKARASLMLGICAIRDHAYKAALRPLSAALGELQIAPHAETFWQVHAALACASRKLGRAQMASHHAALAATSARRAADALSPELCLHFLGNPTVQFAIEGEGARSGWSRFPPAMKALLAEAEGGDPERGLAPVVEAFRRLDAQRSLNELLPAIVESMMDLCGARRGTIALFDARSHREEVSRANEAQDFQPFEMGVTRAVIGIVRETGQPFRSDDVRQSPALDTRADRLLSVLCVPLRVGPRVLGAVYLDTPGISGAFERRELDLAEVVAHHGALALDNVLVHEHAIRDGLTLLYNQAHVEECLEREIAAAREHGRPCGVLMVDIDDFKRTNDGMGHAAGSDLLRALAPMLTSAVRSLDVVARIEERDSVAVVARYGGDEFEIVLPDTGREGLAVVATRILEAMRVTSFSHEERPITVTVSIGGACFPGDAGTARELMRRADEALYQAKQAGKDRYHAYAGA